MYLMIDYDPDGSLEGIYDYTYNVMSQCYIEEAGVLVMLGFSY